MSSTDITIRQAEARDVTDLTSLLGELFALEQDFCFEPEVQRQGVEALLANKRAMLLVAELKGQVLGMCTAQLLTSTAEGGDAALVEDVVVSAEHRGKSLGRKLLAALESWAEDMGVTRLQLLADAENSPALGFYERLGWRMTQLICLRKRLDVSPLDTIPAHPLADHMETES